MKRMLIIGLGGLLWAASSAQGRERLQIGAPAPPLKVAHWVKGEPVDLQKGRGKNVYLIEFWATWCLPCHEQFGHLTELQKKYKDQNLVVVAISDELKKDVEKFMARRGQQMGYTVGCDILSFGGGGSLGKTCQDYLYGAGIDGIPAAFIVDREGRLAWFGFAQPAMDPVLEAVLNGTHDIEQARIEAEAYESFTKSPVQRMMDAMKYGHWPDAVAIGELAIAPESKLSKDHRKEILTLLSWEMVAGQHAERAYFEEALRFVKLANDLTEGKDPVVLDTYARTLFETGRIAEAVEHQTRAVELGVGPMKAELQRNLDKYVKAQQQKNP